ncbi:SPOR domain-containing protein [Vibrio sinaloensis]|uniref:SPOR domain-containing protein n=1 Tax=Photobacterium sp. (strain ATCC 43367) TaxID=379097 RepID=UPI00205E48F9|nr:AAA family ATPase [Vibrio sinaloensis]UPQ88186.1 NACHT domain-containing protein [Vibrio sinaloensis]
MSLAHDPRVLELDSQVELLERLRLLTNFGSNLVTVGGANGAGKTWLAQHYLEAWAQDKNQSLLLCYPNQDDEQRRSTILSQLLSESLFNPADSLADSFSRLMEGESCDVLIVVDDAHLLTESFISELWMLVLEAQLQPRWTVNVLLFAQSNSLDALLTRLSYGQEHKPIDLEIESLSQDEADLFFEHLVIRFVEDDMEKRVRNAYRTVARRPGEIMALGDQKVEKRIIIRSIVGSPINIALLVLVLLLAIGGGYWWMMSQPSPDDKAAQINQALEQTVIPTLPEVTPVEEQEANIIEPAPVEDPTLSDAVDDSMALPPDVTEQVESVGNADDDQQRVVITSDVVDALLEGKAEQADTSAIDQVVEQSMQEESPALEAEPQATAQASEPEQPVVIQFSFTKDELKSFSPRSYTLQLAAVQSLEEVQAFIDQYQLDNQVFIYPTVRNQVDWYIITYQNYPTIQVARDAVQGLSAELQQLEPWAKSLSQVQREIDRVE